VRHRQEFVFGFISLRTRPSQVSTKIREIDSHLDSGRQIKFFAFSSAVFVSPGWPAVAGHDKLGDVVGD
jgi:hypothetical protein